MTPQFKVYRGKEYIAACKHGEDAAALVSLTGEGQVRWGHQLVVWREGAEDFSARESYDGAAAVMHERIDAHNATAFAKTYRRA